MDWHVDHFRVVRMCDGQSPQPAQRFTPASFLLFVQKQLALADRVFVVWRTAFGRHCLFLTTWKLRNWQISCLLPFFGIFEGFRPAQTRFLPERTRSLVKKSRPLPERSLSLMEKSRSLGERRRPLWKRQPLLVEKQISLPERRLSLQERRRSLVEIWRPFREGELALRES
jgi:hypothetical protein